MAAILLRNGDVIDGTGSAPQRNTSVLTDGDNIVAVGSDAESRAAALTENVKVIDATGLTVMPGLLDAHVHVTLGEPASNDELFNRREPISAALLAAHNARKILRAGVTSFLDVDGLFNIGPA
ncbi:MAG: amidohydrolase family protein, partial [Actinomycetota bacterium]